MSSGTPKIYNLLVSESKIIRSQLRWVGFRRLDLRKTVVHSAGEVLEAQDREPCHAVVLESRLPECDAFSISREIKRQHGLADLPLLVISEESITAATLPRIAASGCDEVLCTPLSRGQLYHVLAEYLGLPRRRNYRVRVKAPAVARGSAKEVQGEVYDLAVSGARLRLEEPFPRETRLTVVIETPQGELELPATVVWHRPYARGAELAVQLDQVDEEVAVRLETLATWRVEEEGGQQVVMLQRSFTERSNFTGLAEQLRGHVAFDMSNLSVIASMGIGSWVGFLEQIPAEVTYEFIHCPVTFCMQASYVPKMLGRGRVSSFFAPYICVSCNSEVERELEASAVELETPAAPEVRCAVCGGVMRFEDLPERYFRFLTYKAGAP